MKMFTFKPTRQNISTEILEQVISVTISEFCKNTHINFNIENVASCLKNRQFRNVQRQHLETG